MTNKQFLLLTERKRKAKFKAALKEKSKGGLTGDEIQKLLHILPAKKQYEILVYHRADAFCAGVMRLKGAEKQLILGKDSVSFANQEEKLVWNTASRTVAVMVSKQTALEEYSQLHIFIPPKRCGKERESR